MAMSVRLSTKRPKRRNGSIFVKMIDKKGRVSDLTIDARTAKVRAAKRGGPLKKKG